MENWAQLYIWYIKHLYKCYLVFFFFFTTVELSKDVAPRNNRQFVLLIQCQLYLMQSIGCLKRENISQKVSEVFLFVLKLWFQVLVMRCSNFGLQWENNRAQISSELFILLMCIYMYIHSIKKFVADTKWIKQGSLKAKTFKKGIKRLEKYVFVYRCLN